MSKIRHEISGNVLDLEMRLQIVLREETIAVIMMIVGKMQMFHEVFDFYCMPF